MLRSTLTGLVCPLQLIAGDNAYPSGGHVIAIYRMRQAVGPDALQRRKKFNTCLAAGRIMNEQAIGSVKMRFPITLGTMRLRKDNATAVFLAACVLHNFFLATGGEYFV